MYRRRSSYGFPALIIVFFVVVAAFVTFMALKGTGNDRQVVIHVTDKERVCDSGKSGDCKYLVYTDEGTFKDVDSVLNGKFNSSDVYGNLKRDHAYLVKVEGFRSGPLSEYPNIISIVKEVPSGSQQ